MIAVWQRLDEELITNVEVRNAPPHDHAVHVYADDRAIDREIIRFVEDGLTLGESVVIAANAEHRIAIAAWCSENASAHDIESLLVVDAADMLKSLMVTEVPDPALFDASVGTLMRRASRDGRRVRVFGEMVALLWAGGNVTGALALESLWNDMALNRQFFLLCAYPGVLLDEAPLHAVNAMCERHSDLSLLGYLMQFANTTTATPFHAERLLLPIPTAVPAACQVAVQTLVEWGLSQLIEKCVIITSELAANAVRQAESCFRLTLSRDATRLRIAVEDTVAGLPAARRRSNESNRLGLSRIESIASDWGCDVRPDGKAVWAELPL